MGHRLASKLPPNLFASQPESKPAQTFVLTPPRSFFSSLGPGAALPSPDFPNQARTPGKTPRLLT